MPLTQTLTLTLTLTLTPNPHPKPNPNCRYSNEQRDRRWLKICRICLFNLKREVIGYEEGLVGIPSNSSSRVGRGEGTENYSFVSISLLPNAWQAALAREMVLLEIMLEGTNLTVHPSDSCDISQLISSC